MTPVSDPLRRPRGTDLGDPFEIAQLVRRFYSRVRRDDLLGPIFDEVACVNWSVHLPKLTAFWSGILLGTDGFDGAPMRRHAAIHARQAFEADHFYRWVELSVETAEAGWRGPRADYAKEVAASVARGHGFRLTGEALSFPGTAPGIPRLSARAHKAE